MSWTAESAGRCNDNIGRQQPIIPTPESSCASDFDVAASVLGRAPPCHIQCALETAAAIAATVPSDLPPRTSTAAVAPRLEVPPALQQQPSLLPNHARNNAERQPIAPVPADVVSHLLPHGPTRPPAYIEKHPLVPIAAAPTPPISVNNNSILLPQQQNVPLSSAPNIGPVLATPSLTVIPGAVPPGVVHHPVLATGTAAAAAAAAVASMHALRKQRSGKWTREEEAYADILIELFDKGQVEEKNGVTLRSFLSRKLFCVPMRISKKYAGRGIGKKVFMNKHNAHVFAASCGYTTVPPPPLALTPAYYANMTRLRDAELKFLIAAFPEMAGPYATSHPLQSAPTGMGVANGFTHLISAPLHTQLMMSVAAGAVPAPAILQPAMGPLVLQQQQQPVLGSTTAAVANPIVSSVGPFQLWQRPFLPPGPAPGVAAPTNAATTASWASQVPTSLADPQKYITTSIHPNGATFAPIQPKSYSYTTTSGTAAASTIQAFTPATVSLASAPATPLSFNASSPAPLPCPDPLSEQQHQPSFHAEPSFMPSAQNSLLAHTTTSSVGATMETAIVAGPSSTSSLHQPHTETRVAPQQFAYQANDSQKPAMFGPIQRLHQAYLNSFSTLPVSEASTPVGPVPPPPVDSEPVLRNTNTAYQFQPQQKLIATAPLPNGPLAMREPRFDMMPKPLSPRPMALNGMTIIPLTSEQQQFQNAHTAPREHPVYMPPSSTVGQPGAPDVGALAAGTSNEMPDFLSGFDKVATHHRDSPTLAQTNQDAPYSPTYTSKSFDDFHRFLGKGLSPEVPRVVLPATDVSSFTTLQKSLFPKPKSIKDPDAVTSDLPIMSVMDISVHSKDMIAISDRLSRRSNIEGSENASATTSGSKFTGVPDVNCLKRHPSGETESIVWNHVSIQDMRSTWQLPLAEQPREKTVVRAVHDVMGVPKNDIVAQESSFDAGQGSSYTKKRKQEKDGQEHQHRPHQDLNSHGISLDALCRLESSDPCQTIGTSYANGRVATVSEPSNESDSTSEDPNSGNEGGTMWNDSDGTQSEGSFHGRKQARFSQSPNEEIEKWGWQG